MRVLYYNAKTITIVNSIRQGDPMSCLIFNMAIEYLAKILQDSHFKEMEIREDAEQLITKLFADAIYLSENDNLNDLQSILEDWCKALERKFNVPKITLVTIGSETFRINLITT